MASSRVIEVPIDNSNDVLEIDCAQLPAHAAEICDILENEGTPLRFFQMFAVEYYKQGQVEEAVVALKRGMRSAKANDQTAKLPLLNMLASIYVQKAKSASAAAAAASASSSGGTEGREMWLEAADTLLNEARRISPHDATTALVRGMHTMAMRKVDAALAEFQKATDNGRSDNVAALLGMARVLYGKQQFAQALTTYQRVLVLRPHGKPDARIGIGMCLARLGHLADARRALERAAVVDPQAAAPHIILGTLELNESRVAAQAGDADRARKLLTAGMHHLQEAYRRAPENAAVLLRLSDRLCWRGDWAGARRLAERALRTADTMALQAEAHYGLARAHHGGKRYDLAHESYQRCLSINENHVLARYGLAQMLLQRSDVSGAEAAYQRVLARHPRCSEALRALGHIHARLPNTKAKGLEYYERAMQLLGPESPPDRHDADLFLDAALLYEASSTRRALQAYRVAASLLGTGRAAPPELWNNIGALAHLTGEPAAAIQQAYAHALNALTATEKPHAATPRPSALRVTVTYNVGLFYEHVGLRARATRLYTDLIVAVPSHVEALLRLAVLSLSESQPDRALELVGAALRAEPKNISALLLRGLIELGVRKVQEARRTFESVLRNISKHDIYALCALGNYYLAAARSEAARAQENAASTRSGSGSAAARGKDQQGGVDSMCRALEFFDKCLQIDERCAPAAHGTAIAMAENGFADVAVRLFHDVRDAADAGLGPESLTNQAADLPCRVPVADSAGLQQQQTEWWPPVAADTVLWASVNAAHALAEAGNFRQAVLAYEACLRRLHDSTAALEAATTASAELLVVPQLETVGSDESNADQQPPVIERISAVERTDRARVAREVRLYLARAMYLHAKAAKDLETMRGALAELRTLCADIVYTLPPPVDAAAVANSADSVDTPASDGALDADGDATMSAPVSASSTGGASDKLSSEDSLLLYDLALVEQSLAQLVTDQPPSQRTLAELEQVTQDLEHSTRLFTYLCEWGKVNQKRQKLLFSARLASERSAYGRSLLAKSSRKQEEQEQFEKQRQEQLEQWRRQREEEELEKQRQAEAEAARQKEEDLRILRETEERNAVIRQQMAESAALAASEEANNASSKASRKTKQRGAAADDFIEDDMASDTGEDGGYDLFADAKPVSRKAASGKKGPGRRRIRSKSDHDSVISPSKRRKGDEQSTERTPSPPPTPEKKSKYKSKAIVTDSDDSDDDDDDDNDNQDDDKGGRDNGGGNGSDEE
ncbi:protein required for normal CLN1 and CLN2 G1 cyclin expression [Coemansia sp. Benny D115]|nr:protein required for normal CLN1 and CLN2 G1 cyclin expression [Coemansia sp. Benny D115]